MIPSVVVDRKPRFARTFDDEMVRGRRPSFAEAAANKSNASGAIALANAADRMRNAGDRSARLTAETARDFLAHLAVHQHVSASTQNQAYCAVLFLCLEVLGVNLDGLSPGVRAKRGERPVVLSMPQTVALLDAMSGTPRLMAALIYGGGLRVTECCERRIIRTRHRGHARSAAGLQGATARHAGRIGCALR